MPLAELPTATATGLPPTRDLSQPINTPLPVPPSPTRPPPPPPSR
ncbi:MAG: hypothetical protein M5U34_10820 [Chloroflexi bacterium]|nr:hypothetical protein [Chloroflexota bacterium]